MSQEYLSRFIKLGQRNYIYAGDVINGCLEALNSWEYPYPHHLELSYRKTITTQAYYRLLSNNTTDNQDYFALFTLTDADKSYQVGVYPNFENNQTIPSIPYDEDLLVENAFLDIAHKNIKLSWLKADIPIQKVFIALQKRLLTTLFPTAEGKWVFFHCSFKWNTIAEINNGNIEIRILQHLGHKIVKCLIVFNGQEIGTQCFKKVSS